MIDLQRGHPEIALVLAALAGGALGFLRYNWNPAKIILGDSGALFIGYVFATVSIIGVSKTAFAISLLVPLVVLALPVLDTAATIVRRTTPAQEVLRGGPRAFPPPADLSLRAQRPPSGAADLRGVRRARRDRAVLTGGVGPLKLALNRERRTAARHGRDGDAARHHQDGAGRARAARRAARRRADRVRDRAAPRDARRGARSCSGSCPTSISTS